MIAVLASARPKRLEKLVARLEGRAPLELVRTARFPVSGSLAALPSLLLPGDRFSADAARPFAGRFDAVAIPYSHSHPERHEYANVEEFAAALGAREILRFYANDFFAEETAPDAADVARFHAASAAALAGRKRARLEELAAFTGEPLDAVERRCAQAEEEGFRAWNEARPKTPAEIEDFYRRHDFYLYQLTKANFWSGGRTEYIDDAWRFLSPGTRVIEIGPGVGEVALELARRGCAVSLHDVNRRLLDFVLFKARRRGLELRIASLDDDRFDAVIGFDVLEHLPDPGAMTERLLASLAGPRLFLSRLPDEEEDVPMHFAGTRAAVERVLERRGYRRRRCETDLDVFAPEPLVGPRPA